MSDGTKGYCFSVCAMLQIFCTNLPLRQKKGVSYQKNFVSYQQSAEMKFIAKVFFAEFVACVHAKAPGCTAVLMCKMD